LEKWKQRQGCKATYGKLIAVFESAGYQDCADLVRKLTNSIEIPAESSANELKNVIDEILDLPLSSEPDANTASIVMKHNLKVKLCYNDDNIWHSAGFHLGFSSRGGGQT
jgi:hypothetical protein